MPALQQAEAVAFGRLGKRVFVSGEGTPNPFQYVGQLGVMQVGARQIGPGQFGSSDIGLVQIGPSEVKTFQVDMVEFGFFQVEPRIWMYLPPRGERIRAARHQLNMFGICHQLPFPIASMTTSWRSKRPPSP